MDWKTIQQNLQNATGFVLTMEGAVGKSKTITLKMMESDQMLTFETLGSGSMKRVVRVNEGSWVLALAGDSSKAAADMLGEVRTLIKLSREGIRVPDPFPMGVENKIIFNFNVYNDDVGETKTYPAFLQQYLQGQEMDKLKEKRNFAKDFILNTGLPENIDTTVSDLTNILKVLVVWEWGDFQVIYQKETGFMYVFDPLPENNSGTPFAPLVRRWLADIDEAKTKAHTKV
jgi:hypothetical protein